MDVYSVLALIVVVICFVPATNENIFISPWFLLFWIISFFLHFFFFYKIYCKFTTSENVKALNFVALGFLFLSAAAWSIVIIYQILAASRGFSDWH